MRTQRLSPLHGTQRGTGRAAVSMGGPPCLTPQSGALPTGPDRRKEQGRVPGQPGSEKLCPPLHPSRVHQHRRQVRAQPSINQAPFMGAKPNV